MTSMSAAVPDGRGNGVVTPGLSSVFGVAAASSLRDVVPRRKREVEEMTSDAERTAAVKSASSDPGVTEGHMPESRSGRASDARRGRMTESAPAAVRHPDRAPRPRFRPVQVRDRRYIDVLLLAAAKGSPAGRDLVDFVRERSDGVFVLSRGVVYRELHRLEKERLIGVGRDGGFRRYTLTELGERVLATRRRELEAFSHGLARVLDAADVGGRR